MDNAKTELVRIWLTKARNDLLLVPPLAECSWDGLRPEGKLPLDWLTM